MFPMAGVKQRWCAEITLGTGDTSKTLLAAAAGKRAVVTRLYAHITTAAAQAVDIACGSVNIMRIPASATGRFTLDLQFGLQGSAVNTAIVATPAAAGPAIHFVAEGYYEST